MSRISALAALAISLGAITVSPSALASEAAPEQIALCDNLSTLAKSIMDGRQSGAEADAVIAIVEKVESVPARDYGRRMVSLAYAKPKRPEAESAEAATEFKDLAYQTCIERVVTQPVTALKEPEGEAAVIRLVRP